MVMVLDITDTGMARGLLMPSQLLLLSLRLLLMLTTGMDIIWDTDMPISYNNFFFLIYFG